MRDKITNFVLNKIHIFHFEREGNEIRYKRSRRFKNKYRFITKSIQVLLAWYLFIFSAIQLNSFTNAAFNDVEQIQASVHVQWPVDEWDKSSLDFDKAGLARGGSCLPPQVYAEIFNGGEDMTFSTWTWELYKVGTGNQNKTPISGVLESGEVPKIPKNQKGMIQTTGLLELPGNGQYKFKVTKPDRPGQDAIWSEPIMINDCPVIEDKADQSADDKDLEQKEQDKETNSDELNGTPEEEAASDEQDSTSEEPDSASEEPDSISDEQDKSSEEPEVTEDPNPIPDESDEDTELEEEASNKSSEDSPSSP